MSDDTQPSPRLTEYRLEMAEQRLGDLSQELTEMKIRMENRERDRALQERAFLVRGISFLGFVISVLVGTIWAYRGVIFQGKGP